MAEHVYPAAIRAFTTAFRVMNLKIVIEGAENVPRTGPVVVAINHVSYLDFIFAGWGIWQGAHRLTRYMAKESVFRHRISGPLMRAMHHIPVDRSAGAGSFRAALRALKRDEVVGIFPEGTTSLSFTVKELKTGAVRMAQAGRAPLLPVVTWGGQRIYSKNCPKDFRTRGRTIIIKIGQPITVDRTTDVKAATHDLRVTLQRMLDDAQAQHPDTRNRPAGAWWLPRHLGGTAPAPVDVV